MKSLPSLSSSQPSSRRAQPVLEAELGLVTLQHKPVHLAVVCAQALFMLGRAGHEVVDACPANKIVLYGQIMRDQPRFELGIVIVSEPALVCIHVPILDKVVEIPDGLSVRRDPQ